MSDDTSRPPLRLYDTLARAKRVFEPIDPLNVRMYTCGPTVYDFAHIGNARPVIVFDVLFRLLRHLYGPDHVRYVRNVTDVDDKINARAAAEHPGLPLNEAIARVTDGTLTQFREDVAALGCLPPTVEPRATEHVDEMRVLIDRLVATGHAYVAEGHVLFDVPSMPEYGGLSRRPLDEMVAGSRIEVAPYKRSALDFVLWKPSGAGEPAWASPAGIAAPGRPGWHIECSAMAGRHLGDVFDIHAGGLDLIFPHHENEIAQSRCAHGTPAMANYWLHNGFLQVEGEKMSKSLGNFVTIRDVLKDWPGEVVRLNMLKTHYRQPIDWTVRGLKESERTLDRWNRSIEGVPIATGTPGRDFVEALSEDLNTPAALGVLHTLFSSDRVGELTVDESELGWDVADPEHAAVAVASARLLGLLAAPASEWLTSKRGLAAPVAQVGPLIELRNSARAAKNWAESDRIRDELKAMGVQLKDNKDGTTTWEVAR